MTNLKNDIQVVCIVDGYSSASVFVNHFKKLGAICVHVQSSPEVPDCFVASFKPDVYDANFIFSGDINALLAQLLPFAITAVLAGVDSGTELTDSLAMRLNLPGHPASTSQNRRNKYLMGEAVAKAGLRAVRQACIKNISEAHAVLDDWREFPVVVKPVDSAGSDSVYFCDNAREVDTALCAIVGNTNRLGARNAVALIQERLIGQQYVVNSVSQHGRHFITEVWRDDRIQTPSSIGIYDRAILLENESETKTQLSNYAIDVLNALDFRHGPGHMEVVMTNDGPCLIEVAARPMGGVESNAVEAALGESHISLTVKLHTSSQNFLAAISKEYLARKRIMVIDLISKSSGYIVKSRIEELVTSLPSFFSFQKLPKEGSYIDKTVDLFSSPGMIYFVHESKEQLEEDYHQVRKWERDGALLQLSVIAPFSQSAVTVDDFSLSETA